MASCFICFNSVKERNWIWNLDGKGELEFKFGFISYSLIAHFVNYRLGKGKVDAFLILVIN